MLVSTADRFRDELNPGERIIWTGQPQQGIVLRLADIFLIPFTFLWGGFVLVGAFSVVMDGSTPFPFMLFGIPFVIVALYITIGRFFVDMAQRSATYYALTHERVIILSGLLHQNIKSVNFRRLQEINVSTRSNGRGTITFGHSNPLAFMYAGTGLPNMSMYHMAPSFEMIDHVKTVYQKIKQLQRENHPQPGENTLQV